MKQIRTVIEELHVGFSCPNFEPHVTLAGDLSTPPDLSAKRCQDAFAGSGAIVGRITGIERTSSFFRSLCLNLSFDERFLRKRDFVSRHILNDLSPDFSPHISLAYGLSEKRELDEKYLEEIENLASTQFIFDRIAVVNSAKLIPIEEWSILKIIDL
jgi:2'-5' RNA ligase